MIDDIPEDKLISAFGLVVVILALGACGLLGYFYGWSALGWLAIGVLAIVLYCRLRV